MSWHIKTGARADQIVGKFAGRVEKEKNYSHNLHNTKLHKILESHAAQLAAVVDGVDPDCFVMVMSKGHVDRNFGNAECKIEMWAD
jgi:hypothetical protein